MLKNHLTIAWRGLLKNKGYLLINVLGLALALTVSVLMLLWVYDEYRMDGFHANEDRLYHVKRTIPLEGGVLDVYPGISYPFLKAAKENFAEVESYIILGAEFEDNLRIGDTDLRARGSYTNASFFSGFSYPILLGDASQLDLRPDAIVISESLAFRIWGEQWKTAALGKPIEILDNGLFTVAAVFEDLGSHSSLQGEFYYSFEHFLNANAWLSEWGNNGFHGVLMLSDGANPEELGTKLQNMLRAHIPGENKEGCFLRKYSENYLYNQFDEQARVSGGRIEYLRIFGIASVFLLLISCINFVNLSTAYASRRAGEIGVRKVVGARKSGLIGQFLTETALITLMAFGLAGLATWSLFPLVNTITGKILQENLSEPWVWTGLLGIFIATTLLSGFYPALIISSFRPVQALKGQQIQQQGSISFRKGLVVLQFAISILLIVSATVVRQQVDYIRSKDLGIARDHLISIHQDQAISNNITALQEELMKSTAIEGVTLAGPSPLNMGASSSGLSWPGKTTEQENIEFSLLWTAHTFPGVFEVPMVEGTYYREVLTDSIHLVINERAAEIIGMEDPVGKTVNLWGKPRQILGVLKDFHNQSLHESIHPAVFMLDPENAGRMYIRMKNGRTAEALDHTEAVFASLIPDLPLHYEFLDEEYAAQYRSETLTGKITWYFALISIIISCLGLFGLAAFMARQRTKEIGIRKVLGANTEQIALLLSKDFLPLVLWSLLFASPIAYLVVQNWLGGFEYKVNLSVWVFLTAGIIAVLVSLATTSVQAIRAALADPVKSLKAE